MSLEAGLLWILEDDVDLRTVMVHLAEGMGYSVVALASMQEAWVALANAAAGSSGKLPDFVISDHDLEDGKSIQWQAAVLDANHGCSIICVSGDLDDETRDFLVRLGIKTLNKPATLGEILKILRS